jgi:hypothetical protein
VPLSEAVARAPIHTREIRCEGFRREDGLFDIDGRLVDTKSYSFDNRFRGSVEAGDPVHEMWLRLTVNDRFEVVLAEAVTDKHPYPGCGDITPDYRALVGTRIGPGWSRGLRTTFGGVRGCTHITKLLENMAVAALQTIGPLLKLDRDGGSRRPPQIDGCHVLRSDGAIVREYFPSWYRRSESD